MIPNKELIIKCAEITSIQPIIRLENKWKCEKIDRDMTPYSIKEIKKAIAEKMIVIAIHRDKIVGFIFFNLNLKECELDAIYVEKKYRKCGVGPLLMDYFLNISKVKSCKKVYLLADSIYEDKLVKFYAKYGFKKVAIKMLRDN